MVRIELRGVSVLTIKGENEELVVTFEGDLRKPKFRIPLELLTLQEVDCEEARCESVPSMAEND